MNKSIRILIAVLAAIGCMDLAAGSETPVAIAIHAGAGTIERSNLGEEQEKQIRAALDNAVRAGHQVLQSGGTSLEAITRAVILLEDTPFFNAGKGAVFNSAGKNELDASIMDGATLNAGAVAGVHNIRNPILLASKVMTDSRHVMLGGEGAETFARENNIEFADDAYFHTDYRWQQLEKARAAEGGDTALVSETADRWFSTVGAVAVDSKGNLAAATSTGGMTNKRWGRIGDSPIIGAGTYADNRSCAVSATGHGEYFIRATVARDICSRVQYQGVSLQEAADTVINQVLVEMGGDGGIISIDAAGNIAMPFNTAGMYRASIDTNGKVFVGIYDDE
jgi:beta-aspartyl-peptidase (threonine type)